MLSESVQKDDPIPALAELGKWLASCNFTEFWAGVDKLGSAVFGQVKGFDDAVRTAIVGRGLPLSLSLSSLSCVFVCVCRLFTILFCFFFFFFFFHSSPASRFASAPHNLYLLLL